jgi:hypothetical protein
MFVGLPVRDNVHPLTMAATVSPILQQHGGQLGLEIGCPWIDIARTNIISQFLRSNETHLLFVDSDVWFDSSIVVVMMQECTDVLTCTYRKRKPPHDFCLRPIGNQQPHARRLFEAPMRIVEIQQSEVPARGTARVLEIESDGLGCTLVRRHVIEKMVSDHPELTYVDDDGAKRYWLFQPFVATDAEGVARPACDDKAFFLRARGSGFKVECLIDATIFHDGVEGRFGETFDAAIAQPRAGVPPCTTEFGPGFSHPIGPDHRCVEPGCPVHAPWMAMNLTETAHE